jgi:predicted ribosome quality control (RQC) complex YloA/Tae2 family protein
MRLFLYLLMMKLLFNYLLCTKHCLVRSFLARRHHTQLLISSVPASSNSFRFCSTQTANWDSVSAPLVSSTEQKDWDLRGLKKEVERQYLRLFKKVGKIAEKLNKEKSQYDQVMLMDNPTLEVLETCPNPEATEKELKESQKRLQDIQQLETMLKSIHSVKNVDFVTLLPTIMALNITDSTPPKPERGPKKEKSIKSTSPRKPYFTYKSIDNIDIRVGRAANDNDELSCNHELRDNDDWWLHVSGHAGSHVVIRYTGDDLLEKYRQTVLDAALLAAVNSKVSQGSKAVVSLTRCRNVSKPKGAKPGLVHLNGDITPIKVDIRKETIRLDRLIKID